MKTYLVRFGLWLARLGGWTPIAPCMRPHLPDDSQVDLAKQIVDGSDPLPAKQLLTRPTADEGARA